MTAHFAALAGAGSAPPPPAPPPFFTVNVLPAEVAAYGSNVTPTAQATVSGGAAPYTYLWLEQTPPEAPATIVALAETASSTAWVVTLNGVLFTQATWVCRVTDSSGTVAVSAPITITATDTGVASP